jgi:long-chain acyl-CoA synthetase
MNTADYLLEHGNPEHTALIEAKGEFSYHDLRLACERITGELIAAGVNPGDRVGILGNNSLFWVASYLAVMKLGAVAVPIATTLTSDEIIGMAKYIHLRATCVERRMLRLLGETCCGAVIFEDVLQVDGPKDWPSTFAADEPDSDAALMFTSGTTARPRLVRITHRNIQANTCSIIDYLDLSKEDRVMAILQFFYCFGTSLLHTHLRVGGSIAMATSFVYPELVLNQMETAGCTGLAGVPSNFQTLLRNSTFPKRGFPHLRKIQQAGGKLQPVLIQELVQAVPQAKIFVMYGQTEATARLSYLPPEMLESKLGSIGKGIPNVTLEVIGDDGKPVKPGDVGEIYAWGDNISPGYWNDREASAEKFVDGALHTGDLASVDADGFIFVVDRKADFIKSFGYRISSQRIEECILEIQDVVGAAVIGEPDMVRGEAIWAFVVPRAGCRLTQEDIQAHCAHRMAHYMVPKEVVMLEKLPMNAHGKIVKNELRRLAAEGEKKKTG